MRGGIVVQAASGPNRRARRAAQAKGAARPTLDVNCNVCRVVFVRLPQPRTEAERLAGNEQVARAFRQHVRVTGCVRLEEVAPISLPPAGGRSAEEPKPVDPSSPEGVAKIVRA